MAKIVSISGAPVLTPGEADEEIVAMLERHLTDARAGKTRACAVVSVDGDGWVLGEFALTTHRFTLVGAVGSLLHRINCWIDSVTD